MAYMDGVIDYGQYEGRCWCGMQHPVQSHLTHTGNLNPAHWTPTTSTWTWPSTTYVGLEFSDNGYVGRHRT